jgi:hypothetical protein
MNLFIPLKFYLSVNDTQAEIFPIKKVFNMNKTKTFLKKNSKKPTKPIELSQKVSQTENITPFTISSNVSSSDLIRFISSQKDSKNEKDFSRDLFKPAQVQPIFSILVDESSMNTNRQKILSNVTVKIPKVPKQVEFSFRDLAAESPAEINKMDETHSTSTIPNFDETYLKEEFEKADRDRDQYLELKELHEALLSLYPNCKFGLNTAYFLNKKVGKTSYVKMDFTEFVAMNDYINVLQNVFVENMDEQGFIELLKSTTDNSFSNSLFESLLERIPSNDRVSKCTLSNFILIVTKVNLMRSEYDCKHLNRAGDSMEVFIKKNF